MNIKVEVRGTNPLLFYGWLMVPLAELAKDERVFMVPKYIPVDLATRVEMIPLRIVEIDHHCRQYLILQNNDALLLSDLRRLLNFIPNPALDLNPL
jgi:hypothetical protein